MTAEGAGFIRGSGHHPARTVVTDQYWLSPQFRMIPLLNGREEGVHVEVEDGADD